MPRSFEEIGVVYEVTRERIREIHVRAIRKLRHPSRSKLFMELVEPIDRSIEFADRITEVSEVLLGLAMEVDPNRVRPSVVQLSDLNPDLIKPLTELEVYVRTRNVLEKMPITHIYELVQLKEYQVLRMKNAGRKTLNEIKEILADMGLSFGMRFDDQVLSLLKRATRQE